MSESVEDLGSMSIDESGDENNENSPVEIFDQSHKYYSSNKWKVLSADEVYEMMEGEISKVCDVSQLSRTKARSLLNHFKGDTEKLLEYSCADDPETLELIQGVWEFAICAREKGSTCQICLKTIDDRDLIIFPCNNRTCIACFTSYIQNIVASEDGLVGASIKCPGIDCDYEIDDELVYAIQDPGLVSKYQLIAANHFVQNHRNLQWCPSAGCNNAVQVEAGETFQLLGSVRCDCGHWFCFQCLANSHDPVGCKMLEKWIKGEDDWYSSKWLSFNTKPCPSCGISIESFDGGLINLIFCPKCKQEICVKCLWAPRYGPCDMHFESVPEEQSVSLLLQGNKDRRESYETMELMYKDDLDYYNSKIHGTALDLKFISNAFEILLQCRRVLMHSYVFSHFTDNADNQLHIFEKNLKYLEQVTHSLAEVLYDASTTDTVASLNITIRDSAELCNSHRNKLADHIKEGHEKGWWHCMPEDADV